VLIDEVRDAGAVLAQKILGALPHQPLHHRVHFLLFYFYFYFFICLNAVHYYELYNGHQH